MFFKGCKSHITFRNNRWKNELDKERNIRSEVIKSINDNLGNAIGKNMEVLQIYEKENKTFIVVIINERDDIKMYTYMIYS